MLSGNRGGRQLFDVRGRSRESVSLFVPFVMLAQASDLEPPRVPGPMEGKPARNVGSRRIFPAFFKLQVLDAYRHDHDCKGNQRATARKFNIHRRQIQKWLQCEGALRASVKDASLYDASGAAIPDAVPGPYSPLSRLESRLHEPASRVYKHDARTLKLVAQKLYPSSYPGAMLKDDRKGEVTNTVCYVPKEYQLNDTQSEAIGARPADAGVLSYKLNMNAVKPSLILKDSVSGLKLCSSQTESKSPVQKYCSRPEKSEPCGLPPQPPHAPAAIFPSRPTPLFSSPACSPYGDEPYNLVMSPVARPCVVSPPVAPRPVSSGPVPIGAVAAATSPLPARVAEIVADSKTSAFSPKRKWLQDSLQEKQAANPEPLPILPPKQRVKQISSDEPKPKKPCPDFSIERLCGSPCATVKKEVLSPPRSVSPPPLFRTRYLPPLTFPPPLLLPNRTIPELVSLHFKPEPCAAYNERCEYSPEPTVKEESITDDEDETIDVLSTSPIENKSFDFSGFLGGKRRSFSVEFKLNVLDAFYNDKDCNKNQRATARKFNINRRQVQKWLSLEGELRNEGCSKPASGCAGCPQHCTVSLQHCMEQSCLSQLPTWSHHSALPYPPYLPWCSPYDAARIY